MASASASKANTLWAASATPGPPASKAQRAFAPSTRVFGVAVEETEKSVLLRHEGLEPIGHENLGKGTTTAVSDV